jgi:nitrogen fixation/metabolism regulation signal transduction histidine kinase
LELSPPNLNEAREAISCVVRDVDRAKDIVGRMRDHIKKAPPRRDPFDLNEAVNEVIVMVRSAIAKNGVAVSTQLMDGLVPVQGDRVQLQQVVLNLVLNAVEAMGSVEGERELLISSKQDDAGVLVVVGDTGSGIDPAHRERIFEAFYTTKSSGTGMGLSSAGPSSRLTEDDCGRAPTSPGGPCFNSRCLPVRISRRNRLGGDRRHELRPAMLDFAPLSTAERLIRARMGYEYTP